MKTHEEHIKIERELVTKERGEVEEAAAAARDSIARREKERSAIEAELPAPLVASVHRLEAGRQGMFLAKADDGVCQSCFVRVRPQGFQEIKLALKIHYCSNCRRLLVHEPSLDRMAAEAAGKANAQPSGETDQVGAVDGGAA